MISRKRVYVLRIINALLFVLLISVQYNSTFSIKLWGANPMLPLALLTAISMFSSEFVSAVSGLIFGIFIDCTANTPAGFNAIMFLILGLAVSLTVRHLFNNNIFSAVASCLLGGFAYYFLRWIFCFAFSLSFSENLTYLMRIAFPSVIYTAVFIIPFYFLERFLYNKFYYR